MATGPEDSFVTRKQLCIIHNLDEAEVSVIIKALGLNKQGKGPRPKTGTAPDLYDEDEFASGWMLLQTLRAKAKPQWVPPPKEET